VTPGTNCTITTFTVNGTAVTGSSYAISNISKDYNINATCTCTAPASTTNSTTSTTSNTTSNTSVTSSTYKVTLSVGPAVCGGETYSSSTIYNIGDVLFYNGVYYKAQWWA